MDIFSPLCKKDKKNSNQTQGDTVCNRSNTVLLQHASILCIIKHQASDYWDVWHVPMCKAEGVKQVPNRDSYWSLVTRFSTRYTFSKIATSLEVVCLVRVSYTVSKKHHHNTYRTSEGSILKLKPWRDWLWHLICQQALDTVPRLALILLPPCPISIPIFVNKKYSTYMPMPC